MKLIPLTKGMFTMVDDADYDELMKYKWYASGNGGSKGWYWYARTNIRIPGKGQKGITMHAHLTGFKKVHHADGNSLNNQRANFRDGARCPTWEGELKRCPRCDTAKPADAFNRNKVNSDGLQTYCRSCQKEICRENRVRNPLRRRSDFSSEELAAIRKENRDYYASRKQQWRANNILSKFGITYEEKEAMFEAQEGRCGSCFGELPPMGVEGVKEPGIDHSYATGKVRSLLDTGCNTAEGQLKRDFRNAFALGMYQMNDGPYYGPITVISDLGTWTSVVKRVDGAICRVWERSD